MERLQRCQPNPLESTDPVLVQRITACARAVLNKSSKALIGAGSRLDNLVHIAHNVRLGRCCVPAGQVGIAGSTVLEDFVQAGGQAGLAGHLRVGKGAKVGAQAGVIADTPPGAALVSFPAQPRQQFFRQMALLKRMAHGGFGNMLTFARRAEGVPGDSGGDES